jgi:hypothetical protein
MEKKDAKEFSDIMLAIADNYPGATFSSAGLKLRFEALKEFTIDQISEAAVKLISTHKYKHMPTTADIIDAIGGRISVSDRAEIEANKILDHLRRHGKSVIPEFKDPITKYLMNSRWRYYSWAARVAEDDLKWWFRDFVRVYRAHAAGAGVGLDCLPGHPELRKLSEQICFDV